MYVPGKMYCITIQYEIVGPRADAMVVNVSRSTSGMV